MQQRCVAGLLLSSIWAEDINGQRKAPSSNGTAARVRSMALSSKCVTLEKLKHNVTENKYHIKAQKRCGTTC